MEIPKRERAQRRPLVGFRGAHAIAELTRKHAVLVSIQALRQRLVQFAAHIHCALAVRLTQRRHTLQQLHRNRDKLRHAVDTRIRAPIQSHQETGMRARERARARLRGGRSGCFGWRSCADHLRAHAIDDTLPGRGVHLPGGELGAEPVRHHSTRS